MRWRGTRRALALCLIVAVLPSLALAGLIASFVLDGNADTSLLVGSLVLALVAIIGTWIAFTVLDGHFDALERLRGAVVSATTDTGVWPRQWAEVTKNADEVDRLGESIGSLIAARHGERTRPHARLEAVLRGIDKAILVVTETGLVSLTNGAASGVFGVNRAMLGTSVYDGVTRASMERAFDLATEAAGRAVPVGLETVQGLSVPATVTALDDPGGLVIVVERPDDNDRSDEAPTLDHDLSLHDLPPIVAVPIFDAAALLDLPVVVFDCETTGLDPTQDRMISIGMIRVHGQRLYPASTLDLLVDPERPIPAKSMAVHGITNAMVAGAAPFADHWSMIADMMRDCVVVGHHVGFDLALLKAEVGRIGGDWVDPPRLDTALMAAATDPNPGSLELDDVAAQHGVTIRGRHTALGDAIVTAELYVRLLPKLIDQDAATLGAAQALTGRMRRKYPDPQGWESPV